VYAAHLHGLVQVREDHLRRRLGGQIDGVHADERSLRCKSHIFAVGRNAETGDGSMFVGYQEQELAVPIEQVQRSGGGPEDDIAVGDVEAGVLRRRKRADINQ